MAQKKEEVIVLAQSLEQPRIVKRITELSKDYDEVVVYGFKRSIHAVNNFSALSNFDNVKIEIIGNLSNSKYLGRVGNYMKLIFKIFNNYGIRHKCIYVFGLDLRMLSSLLINKSIVYEISDIVWLYSKGVKKFLLSNIDFLLSKNSDKIIFTSYGFYKKYYRNVVDESIIEVKENKLKSYDKVYPIETILEDKIRIAYIGAFRYKDIIKRLIAVVSNNNRYELNFYGDCHDTEIINMIKKSEIESGNIFFHGPFKNPDDLENIYSQSNINFVAYNNSLENEKVAMPNKFYESGFFNIPIVSARNTYLSERVLDNNMGWAIGVSFNEINEFLEKLSIEEIKQCHDNIKKLDKSLFTI